MKILNNKTLKKKALVAGFSAFLVGCAPKTTFVDFMDYPITTTAKSIRYLSGGNMEEESKGNQKESKKWHIDNNMLYGSVVGDDVKCVYSTLVKDESFTTIDISDKLDLSKCPEDFREKYKEHVQAWKNNNRRDINKTYSELVKIASNYGVIKE